MMESLLELLLIAPTVALSPDPTEFVAVVDTTRVEKSSPKKIHRPLLSMEKFQDPDWTAKNSPRASVQPRSLQTLWFNTGTLCNLQCENCYIESSPKNDRFTYITTSEVETYLQEAETENMAPQEIAFTGGEPFMNPEFIQTLHICLERGYQVLVLTNAMKPMEKKKLELLEILSRFPTQLTIRVSMDHYTQELHAKERGPKAWLPALKGLKWLSTNKFPISVAGRTLWNESETQMRQGYRDLFTREGINIDSSNPEALILFPEMDENVDVPEITTECWELLKLNPDDMMCASSRMIVKRRDAPSPSVVACTLLPYDEQFDFGHSLKKSWKTVKLNHPHCAKFCVLGGGSCSQN